jgi:DNA-binding transcriptional LysR family regulator
MSHIPSLDIDLLRTFLAVTEAGALSHAAPRIGRTQAAISMQIKRLEEVIGQPLFNRGGRGISLTHDGERLLARAQDILALHDEAVAELTGRGLAGILRFGCPDDYAATFLPRLIRGFAEAYPAVLLDVVCASTPRLNERLRDYGIDLALVSVPANAPGPEIIRYEPLVWVMPVGGEILSRAVLPLALSDPDAIDHQAARRGLEAQGRAHRIAYASGSLTGLISLVRSGQAIAVMTRSVVPPDLIEADAAAGLPELPVLGIAIAIARPRPSALVAALAAHIRAELPRI